MASYRRRASWLVACAATSLLNIYSVASGKVTRIAVAPIYQAPVDLDHDGVVELVVADWRWEFFHDLCHACSPGGDLVYQWDGSSFVYASPRFKAYNERQIQRFEQKVDMLNEELRTEDDNSPALGNFEGAVVSLAIAYAHAGRREEGLAQAVRRFATSGVNAERREQQQEVLADLRFGNSAEFLDTPKLGQPLPDEW
jgi:hypothetical protein